MKSEDRKAKKALDADFVASMERQVKWAEPGTEEQACLPAHELWRLFEIARRAVRGRGRTRSRIPGDLFVVGKHAKMRDEVDRLLAESKTQYEKDMAEARRVRKQPYGETKALQMKEKAARERAKRDAFLRTKVFRKHELKSKKIDSGIEDTLTRKRPRH